MNGIDSKNQGERADFARDCFAEALILLLSEKSYSAITINDIVQKSGFSRMTFYRAFDGKKQCLQHYLRKDGQLFYLSAMEALETLPLEDCISKMLESLKSREWLYPLLSGKDTAPILASSFETDYSGASQNGQDGYYAIFLFGGLLCAYLRWAAYGFKEDAAEIAASFVSAANERLSSRKEAEKNLGKD